MHIDSECKQENQYQHKSLEKRIAAYGGKIGSYKEYDWGNLM